MLNLVAAATGSVGFLQIQNSVSYFSFCIVLTVPFFLVPLFSLWKLLFFLMSQINRLATVEVQLVMRILSRTDRLRFARTSRRFFHDAYNAFAWPDDQPFRVSDLRNPFFRAKLKVFLQRDLFPRGLLRFSTFQEVIRPLDLEWRDAYKSYVDAQISMDVLLHAGEEELTPMRDTLAELKDLLEEIHEHLPALPPGMSGADHDYLQQYKIELAGEYDKYRDYYRSEMTQIRAENERIEGVLKEVQPRLWDMVEIVLAPYAGADFNRLFADEAILEAMQYEHEVSLLFRASLRR